MNCLENALIVSKMVGEYERLKACVAEFLQAIHKGDANGFSLKVIVSPYGETKDNEPIRFSSSVCPMSISVPDFLIPQFEMMFLSLIQKAKESMEKNIIDAMKGER